MSYRGAFMDDQFSGFGHLELEDGSAVVRPVRPGQRHGEGKRSDAQRQRIHGHIVSFWSARRHWHFQQRRRGSPTQEVRATPAQRQGRFENADGDVWIGEFKDGALTGQGEFIGVDGSHYRGQFNEQVIGPASSTWPMAAAMSVTLPTTRIRAMAPRP